MKIFFLGLLLIGLNSSLLAQDSTKTLSEARDTASIKPNPLLYNYTSSSITNVFNEDLREGANNRITIDFDYAANSNSVPVGIAYSMIFKGAVSKSVKDRGTKRMKDQLRFEDFMKTGITYKRYLKKWDGFFYVSYHHRQMRNILAPKEAYQLAFYGNAMFENDTIDLSNIRFQNFIYNQIAVGIKKKIDYGTYQMQFGAGLSLLQVINNQDISTKDSWLYTAPDGEYIDVNYDLTFNNSKEGGTSFTDFNGIGGSGDFNLGFMNRDKWKLTLDVFDVGFMKFKKNPMNYNGTKMVHFQGIGIPDFTSFSSQTFDNLNLDSTAKANLPAKSSNEYTLFVPFSAQLAFSKPLLHNKLVLTGGLQYRHFSKYLIYGFVKANYFIKPDMVFSVTGGAGNYSLFNLGVEFSKSWKYFDFAVGTSNLIGLVAPSHYTGTGLYFRLGTSF
ncbi:MAG: DUF5723 family protein [Bacteroidota bacterium]